MNRTPPRDGQPHHDEERHARDQGEDALIFVPVDFDIDAEFLPEEQPPSGGTAAGAHESPRPDPPPSVPAVSSRRPAPTDQNSSVGSFSIAELLDTGVALDWREAVSIARRMCEAIARHPAAGTHEYLLDLRHIAIMESGDVVVTPGEPGSDPFVRQVGRILRVLLEGQPAPAQLRLLVSQAVFELPGFNSLDEFSEALRNFDLREQHDPVRTAFSRARQLRYSVSRVTKRPIDAPVLPERNENRAEVPAGIVDRRLRTWGSPRQLAGAAAVLAVAAGVTALWLDRSADPSGVPRNIGAVETADANYAAAEQTAGAPTVSPDSVATPQESPTASGEAEPRASEPVRSPGPPSPATRPDAASAARRPATGGSLDTVTPAPSSLLPASAPPLPPMNARLPAALAPDVAPDRSLRTLAVAFEHFNRARGSLDADNYESALAEAGRAQRLLGDLDANIVPSELLEQIRQLVGRAEVIRAREEARVYTIADKNVIPPLAIGRQMPSAAPAAIERAKIGTLEIVISRDGHVETLRLRTPLNRFHERMIVSAAKAWRYRPALKDGRPVRYLLISSINLPES